MSFRFAGVALLPAFVLAALCPAPADAAGPVDPEGEPTAVPAADGYRWGGFLVRPELALSLVYDSNIFATRNEPVSDNITLVTPSLGMASQWEHHRLNLAAGATKAWYRRTDSENYQDHWVEVDGRYDLSGPTNLFGGAGFAREHEDRSSPEDDLAGSEPTTFTSRRAHGGVAHSWNRVGVRLGATFEHLDFRDVAPVNHDDRDRDLTGVGARVSYRLDPRYMLFGQAVHDARRYDAARDDYGFDRDSAGQRLALGFTGIFSNRLTGSAYLGHIRQSYDDARFSEVSAPDFSGRLTFRVAPKTELAASLGRTLEETTLAGASGYLYTTGALELTRRITPRLRATAGFNAARAEYQGIERRDNLYGAEAGLRYMLSPNLYVAASYRVTSRDTNLREAASNPASPQELDDFARQQVFLTLGTLLYPVPDRGIYTTGGFDSLPTTAIDWQGFFLGAQLAHGSSGLEGLGVRGGSGTDEAGYADAGAGFGLFAGYGVSLRRWYMGVELEADRTAIDIHHRKDKSDSRTLDMDRGAAAALSLRGGYRLAGGELLYLRLGRARGEFDVYYTLNDAPQNAVDQSFQLDGTRYGVGSDIPAGRHLFVRLDYSHTEYDELTADLVTETERLTPAESLFRLGLGWRFAGNARPGTDESAPDLRGLYAGASLAHGLFGSHARGTHNDSGGTDIGPFEFLGDFGDQTGMTGGAFLGYGGLWKRWYGAVELTAEASTAEWGHARDPNGRNFSVEKRDTYGIGLRGGYQLPGGALLYARADRVRTGFDTTWVKGGNRTNDVDRDDRVHGTRVGVGAEMPATRSLFVRMEYSLTDYDAYGFTTAHGNPDSMSFENRETLFRLGLGARFR